MTHLKENQVRYLNHTNQSPPNSKRESDASIHFLILGNPFKIHMLLTK